MGALRREMNGAVADGMYVYGRPYGLNYGVSLPTLRSIARAEGCDHDFARYLFRQQVRELRLAAFHIADPLQTDMADASFWAEGIINSEVAEEAAFALLHKSPSLKDIYSEWSRSGDEILAYSALMAVARGAADDAQVVGAAADIVSRYPSSRIVAQGTVALLAAAYEIGPVRASVTAALDSIRSLRQSLAAEYVIGEMSWRMEPSR